MCVFACVWMVYVSRTIAIVSERGSIQAQLLVCVVGMHDQSILKACERNRYPPFTNWASVCVQSTAQRPHQHSVKLFSAQQPPRECPVT